MRQRSILRAGAAAITAAGLGLAVPAGAAAHVTIKPDVNTSGSYSKITVRVPNESDSAATTEVRLEFPENTFGSVRVQPHHGWTAAIASAELDEPVEVGQVTLDEVITAVTWTADVDGIGPSEFDEFAISLGPLPEPGTYAFPAIQTYADGEVVAWDMPPVEEGEEEPELPAPTMTVVEAGEADGDGHGNGDADDASIEVSSDSSSDELARVIAVGGAVVGLAGLGLGAAAFRRSRA